MKLRISTMNAATTQAIGEKIGHRLKGGETIELISDLGGGKTTFTKGLAKGVGSADHVASPTFTVNRIYQGKTLQMHHFDFYRLNEAGLMEHEIGEALGEPNSVVVVEWGDVVAHVLPDRRLSVSLRQTGETGRELELDCPEQLAYLTKEIT